MRDRQLSHLANPLPRDRVSRRGHSHQFGHRGRSPVEDLGAASGDNRAGDHKPSNRLNLSPASPTAGGHLRHRVSHRGARHTGSTKCSRGRGNHLRGSVAAEEARWTWPAVVLLRELQSFSAETKSWLGSTTWSIRSANVAARSSFAARLESENPLCSRPHGSGRWTEELRSCPRQVHFRRPSLPSRAFTGSSSPYSAVWISFQTRSDRPSRRRSVSPRATLLTCS